MPAFQFPDPTVEQSVVNPSTGTTYIWKADPGKWVLQTHNSGTLEPIDFNLPYTLAVGEVDSNAGLSEFQIFEAISLNDAKGTSLGALAFQSNGGIGVAFNNNYSIPVIQIQGYQLNDKIDANTARLDNLDLSAGDVQLTGFTNTTKYSISVNGDLEKGVIIPLATNYLAGLFGPDDRKHLYTWSIDNYYSKEEIDNQFTLRGVGYNYLLSGLDGRPQIRPGEFNTDNRIVGQITVISIAPEDDNGKNRRDAVIGDTIELYDPTTEKYYRYLINSVADGTYGVNYQSGEADQDNILGVGNPFLIYLYPTHISSANYYDKAASDDRFVSLKPGVTQICQRGITFQAPLDYTGAVQYANNITNKRYVDEQVATRASIEYVNSEVDKMLTSFNSEDAEPDIFYGDYAPTVTMKNGNMWFDSMNLRLNVWSQGTWINPDRNDGAELENRISALEARIAQLEGN